MCSEAVVSKLVKLETSFRYSDVSPNGECSLTRRLRSTKRTLEKERR